MGRPTPICRRMVGKPRAPCVVGDPASRPFDPVVDATLRDYLNLLQVGFVPHARRGLGQPHPCVAGRRLPRTLVEAGAGLDDPADPDPGGGPGVARPAAGASPPRLAGTAVATNGPFVTVLVHGVDGGGQPTSAGTGGLLVDADGVVDVAVHVEVPTWVKSTESRSSPTTAGMCTSRPPTSRIARIQRRRSRCWRRRSGLRSRGGRSGKRRHRAGGCWTRR